MVELPQIEPNDDLRKLTGFDALIAVKTGEDTYDQVGVLIVDGKPVQRKIGTITRTSGKIEPFSTLAD